jgi:TatA/E family protein of Tat protein translocase
MPLPSGFEWIVILVIALLILGPGKLPDVASAVGKSLREFRKASSDVQEAVKLETSPLPAGPAQQTAPAAPATPTPNVLQTTAQPNVLQTPAAEAAAEPGQVADASPSDASPTANG